MRMFQSTMRESTISKHGATHCAGGHHVISGDAGPVQVLPEHEGDFAFGPGLH
jgi:hypothetical protein